MMEFRNRGLVIKSPVGSNLIWCISQKGDLISLNFIRGVTRIQSRPFSFISNSTQFILNQTYRFMRLALIFVCLVIGAIQAMVIGTRDNNIVERHDYRQLIDQAQFVKLVAQYLPHLLDRERQALTPTN